MACKAAKERVNAVSDFLKENGIRFEVEEGGKHPKMVLLFEKEKRKLTLTSSPSDRRGLLNFIGDVRRLVNSMRQS